jgi:wyosine [tRNA(Phe)-imidazoG37] synthetase (radical SAM superfamily)
MRVRNRISYIYGPVPSRRLGYSLGIDVVAHKICSYDCIYCQLGKTTNLTLERKVYVEPAEIIRQVIGAVDRGSRIDYLTFSGSGEPTLNSRIGYIINEIKAKTPLPVAVITNGSLLFMPEVQRDLSSADVVLPTLCAARDSTMRRINRMHAGISARVIIDGMADFRAHYDGQIWLEIMLIRGINDLPDEIAELKKAVDSIIPDKVQLNTVVRPSSEKNAQPLGTSELERVCELLGGRCEIIAEFKDSKGPAAVPHLRQAIMDMVKRRPVTADDIARSLGADQKAVQAILNELHILKKIEKKFHGQALYYGMPGLNDKA